MMRVLIIGNAGSGKSTLARAIADTQAIPVVHLDRLFWRPGWQEATDADFRASIAAAVAKPAWVIDGNNTRTFDLRMPAADTIIWLDFPRWLCLARAIRRAGLNHGRTRADIADGCPEKIDLAFLKWIWDYPRRSRPKTLSALARHGAGKQIVILRSRGEVGRFLASLAPARQC